MPFLTPQANGELNVLKTYILQQLAQIRSTAHGLTNDQAHSTPTASSLNISGLLLHTAQVGLFWTSAVLAAPNRLPLDSIADEDRSTETLSADGRLLPEILKYFDQAVQEIKHNLESIADLNVLVPTPDSPWIPANITHWEGRWCLQHVIAEIARHAGHADIIRETIDGKGSYELNALADSAG
ncbi:DUF664 domain-containing protein [Corynebacterium hindlerae]|uniref:mycothiol transferase n=1 Tax=Corynebacterium hindlerae TaxID=699041 RepID=UPI0031B68944